MTKLKIDSDILLQKFSNLFENEENNFFRKSSMCLKRTKHLITKNIKNSIWERIIYSRIMSNKFVKISDTRSDFNFDKKNFHFFDTYRIFFINGLYSLKLSDTDIGNWKIKMKDREIKDSFKESIFSEFFLYLNENLIKKPICIQLPEGKLEDKPLCLIHIISGSHHNQSTINMINYYHDIEIKNNAQGSIIEYFINFSSKESYLTCTKSKININNNTNFQYVKLIIQDDTNYYFSNNEIFIKHNSIVNSNTFILGSGFSKHRDNIVFNDNQSKIFINNLLLSSQTGVNEINSYIVHKKNVCTSYQKHKILSFEESKNLFNGIIKISSNTYKNNANMLNNNFLIGKLSTINTEPKLEIDSEDVKCSHGATIGKIDKELIFYLCSRGITKSIAIRTILFSICKEIVQTIDNIEIKNIISTYIKNFLKEKINELSYSKNKI